MTPFILNSSYSIIFALILCISLIFLTFGFANYIAHTTIITYDSTMLINKFCVATMKFQLYFKTVGGYKIEIMAAGAAAQ